jgi:hypothetical protein
MGQTKDYKFVFAASLLCTEHWLVGANNGRISQVNKFYISGKSILYLG